MSSTGWNALPTLPLNMEYGAFAVLGNIGH